MKVEQCITESLLYERAWSRISSVISMMREAKKQDDSERDKKGEDRDESFGIVILGLKSLGNEYWKESQRLWKKAEEKSELYDWALENMLNAVILTAAEDYEVALSGDTNQSEKLLIEEFADILGDRIVNIMKRIKRNHAEFVRLARKNKDAIIAETKRNKKLGIDMNYSSHKCPNCGGGMYVSVEFGAKRICCARCKLFEVIGDDD